jgi:triphosphatase
MRLELVLSPGDTERLARSKVLASAKAGRWRQRATAIVWHDSPDGALASDGLCLSERSSLWRLERMLPGAEPWPPGAPAPMLEEAPAFDRLTHSLPTGLQHIARFQGTLRSLPLTFEGSPLILETIRGTIGWARRRREAARVVLGGDEAGVLELARRLAGELTLAVPTACLAAEARAVVVGTTPPPRHQGPPVLRPGLTVAQAFGQVVGHLTDVILDQAAQALVTVRDPEPVHQMRVAVRRLRSAFAVFRPAIGCGTVDAANAALKELAHRLAPARDWDVFVAETCAAVGDALPDDKELARLRMAAERRRRAAYAHLRSLLTNPSFRQLGITLAGLAGGEAWLAALEPTQQEILNLGLEQFADRALGRRLRRIAEAGGAIDHLDPAALHTIRLRAKRMRYAAEVFAPLYPGKAARRYLRRLSALQDRLGALNDGAVADALLTEIGANKGGRAHAGGLIRGFLAARSGDARARIARAWERFKRLEPFWG